MARKLARRDVVTTNGIHGVDQLASRRDESNPAPVVGIPRYHTASSNALTHPRALDPPKGESHAKET
jgi:hypothetical protein